MRMASRDIRLIRSRIPIFLDTAYVTALINTRDQWHGSALKWEEQLARERRRLVTTEFVLTEIADSLAVVHLRMQAARLITGMQANSLIEVIPASTDLFLAALRLYQARPD